MKVDFEKCIRLAVGNAGSVGQQREVNVQGQGDVDPFDFVSTARN